MDLYPSSRGNENASLEVQAGLCIYKIIMAGWLLPPRPILDWLERSGRPLEVLKNPS